jgi:ParB family chromosome partitioning protein
VNAQEPTPKPVTTSVALSSLVRHPDNVRKTTATGIAELAASIERDGLLQNLTVVADVDRYLVVAGGRRLAALQLLHKQKKLPDYHPVAVRIIDACNAEAVSLAENQLREAMHPIDQFLAFKAQVDANHSIADVAARFGVTETFVKQRLKLAAVSPDLLDAYRAGKMTLEQLQAFSVTDNHDRQLEVWDKIKDSRWDNDPEDIKGELLDDAVSAKDVRLKFVGLQAYQKAGGAIIAADLFASEDDVAETVSDPELLDRLALEKLQKRSAKLQKDEGLAWCDAVVTTTWHFMRENYGTVPTVLRDMTKTEAKLHAELEAKLDALQKRLDAVQEADDFDYEKEEKLCAEMEPLEEQRDAIDEACKIPHPDAIEYAGAVVSIDEKGKVEITRNLIRQADMKHMKPVAKTSATSSNSGNTDDDITEPVAAGGHSEKLIRRMTAHKTAILRNQVAKTKCGLNIVVFHMLVEDYRTEFGIYSTPLTMSTRIPNRLESAADDIGDSTAMQAFEAREDELMAPIRADLEGAENVEAALYDFLASSSSDYLMQLLSLCVAKRIDLVVGSEAQACQTGIIEDDFLTDLIVAEHWKPTRASYFDNVAKGQIVDVVRQNAGDERAAFVAKLPKSDAADRAEELMQTKDWLPKPMRITLGGAA